jgi:hypothetical protein
MNADTKIPFVSIPPVQHPPEFVHSSEEFASAFLRSSSSTADASRSGVKLEPRLDSIERSAPRNTNTNDRNPGALPSRANDELGNPLTVKREVANQNDMVSQSTVDPFNVMNRGQSSPEADPLAVKRELENQDDARAQEMFKLLDAVNRGQSTHGDGPSSGKTKRDFEDGELNTPFSSSHHPGSWSQTPRHPPPNRDPGRRDGHSSSSNSFRDHDERGVRERGREREWRDGGGRDRQPASADRKRSLEHHDQRGREDRGPNDRREHPDKRSRPNYR